MERAELRAQRFQHDPYVLAFGPFQATCRKCNTIVKGSPKSTYDYFHWARHRDRCIKGLLVKRNYRKIAVSLTVRLQ